jgi:hypothetical protein
MRGRGCRGGVRPGATRGDREPARTCSGHHPATIESDLSAERCPNAVEEPNGRREWRIPVGDLVAAGRSPADAVQAVGEHLAAAREARATRELREQVLRLEERLTAAEAANEALRADKAQLHKTVDLLMKKVAGDGSAADRADQGRRWRVPRRAAHQRGAKARPGPGCPASTRPASRRARGRRGCRGGLGRHGRRLPAGRPGAAPCRCRH